MADKKRNFDVKFKILLLGEALVGKTNLLSRFCGEKFSEQYMLTLGVDFKERVLESDGLRCMVSVWDTAGQERFQAISPTYYRAVDGVMFVYSIDNRASFDRVSAWLESVDKFSPDPNLPRLLVGNKSDLVNDRQVSEAEGRALAESRGMGFLEASAKTKMNVDQAFQQLTDHIRSVKHVDRSKNNNNNNINNSNSNTVSLDHKNDEKDSGCC